MEVIMNLTRLLGHKISEIFTCAERRDIDRRYLIMV